MSDTQENIFMPRNTSKSPFTMKSKHLYSKVTHKVRGWAKKGKFPTKCPVENLLENEIKTLDDLERVSNQFQFVAFDCEFLKDEIRATEVGIASISTLKPARLYFETLADFVSYNKVNSSSIKINEHYFARIAEISKFERGWPRESFEFGIEKYVGIRDLERRLCETVKQHNKGSAKPMILVAYDMSLDIEAMRRDFPKLARMFTHILDIRICMKAFMDCQSQKVPGISKSLSLLGYSGYHSHNKSGGKFEQYHNAGNDAVRTLAVLQGLIEPQQAKALKLSASVDLGMTNVIKDVHIPPSHWENAFFIETQISSVSLPECLQSPLALAAFVTSYTCPTRIGLFKGQQYNPKYKKWCGFTRGWGVMPSQQTLENFVSATNGKVIHGTCMKSGPYTIDVAKTWRNLGVKSRKHERKTEKLQNLTAKKVNGQIQGPEILSRILPIAHIKSCEPQVQEASQSQGNPVLATYKARNHQVQQQKGITQGGSSARIGPISQENETRKSEGDEKINEKAAICQADELNHLRCKIVSGSEPFTSLERPMGLKRYTVSDLLHLQCKADVHDGSGSQFKQLIPELPTHAYQSKKQVELNRLKKVKASNRRNELNQRKPQSLKQHLQAQKPLWSGYPKAPEPEQFIKKANVSRERKELTKRKSRRPKRPINTQKLELLGSTEAPEPQQIVVHEPLSLSPKTKGLEQVNMADEPVQLFQTSNCIKTRHYIPTHHPGFAALAVGLRPHIYVSAGGILGILRQNTVA